MKRGRLRVRFRISRLFFCFFRFPIDFISVSWYYFYEMILLMFHDQGIALGLQKKRKGLGLPHVRVDGY